MQSSNFLPHLRSLISAATAFFDPAAHAGRTSIGEHGEAREEQLRDHGDLGVREAQGNGENGHQHADRNTVQHRGDSFKVVLAVWIVQLHSLPTTATAGTWAKGERNQG